MKLHRGLITLEAQKNNWRVEGLMSLHFHMVVHHHRKPGLELTQESNLEAGADAEAMEDVTY